MCPACGRARTACICHEAAASRPPQGDGIVRVRRETKGRKGKGVTVIAGIPLDPDGIRGLAKDIKKALGTGGTVKGADVEIQGDHRAEVIGLLEQKGYRVRRAGG